MKKTIILKIFKTLWVNYISLIAEKYVLRTSNTYDDKILAKINDLIIDLT